MVLWFCVVVDAPVPFVFTLQIDIYIYIYTYNKLVTILQLHDNVSDRVPEQFISYIPLCNLDQSGKMLLIQDLQLQTLCVLKQVSYLSARQDSWADSIQTYTSVYPVVQTLFCHETLGDLCGIVVKHCTLHLISPISIMVRASTSGAGGLGSFPGRVMP